MQYSIHNNTDEARFELKISGDTVFADYELKGDVFYITHVEAPPALRGTGAAGIFMKEMVELIAIQNKKLIPICGYAVFWLKRHPEYADVISRR